MGDGQQSGETAIGVADAEYLQQVVGRSGVGATVVIERGPVTAFADAVLDDSPVYREPSAATAAGFTAIPAPPTFAVAMEAWGRFAERQPPEPVIDVPAWEIMAPFMARGGLILHGDQEFEYHRPVMVGDVLVSEWKVVKAYQRESGASTMTFVLIETNWFDEATGKPVVTARANAIHRS
jgi:peroxisomal enoyl-CoA hydratase 2